MVKIKDTRIDSVDVTFHTFPQAPSLHYVAVEGETCGTIEVTEIGLNKNGHFRALWRAKINSTPKPKSALFHDVEDAVEFIVAEATK